MGRAHERTLSPVTPPGPRRPARRAVAMLGVALGLGLGSAGGGAVITALAATTVVTVSSNLATLPANGTSTAIVTATVTRAGSGVNNDPVLFTTGGGPTCGPVAPTSTRTGTDGSGRASTTYTAANTAGSCTITAREEGGASGTLTIAQGAVSVAVSVTPAVLPPNGSATAAVVATVTSSGAGVTGDVVTFTTAGGAACGSVAPTRVTSGSGGDAAATYTAARGVGSCVITAREASQGISSSASVRQGPVTVAITASPPTLPADGSATSAVTATVTTSGVAIAGDTVLLTLSGYACGSVSPARATTNGSGQVLATYRVGTRVGSCTVAARESSLGVEATVVITAGAIDVTVTATPTRLPADGTALATITASVHGAGAAIPDDPVAFTLSGVGCGSVSPTHATTNGNGQAFATFRVGTRVGSCTVAATESSRGAIGVAVISTAAIAITVTSSPALLPADGTARSVITATVVTLGVALPGDVVAYTLRGPACGTVSPTSAPTSGNGQSIVAYTASRIPGSCEVTAREAGQGAAAAVVITQGAVRIQVAASPASLAADGVSRSRITATVSSIGARLANDAVEFSLLGAACGALSTGGVLTNAYGQAVVLYIASTAAGSCTVTAREAAAGASASVTLTQSSLVRAGSGYWIATRTGHVYAFGSARFAGSLLGRGIHVHDVVAMAEGPAGRGYWLATADGHVYAFGTARFKGSPVSRGRRLTDVVGIAASRGATGYWVLTRSGHVLQFGTAPFNGSPVARRLRVRDAVSITAAPGGGYWIATRDGHVYAFGRARFEGSPVRQRLHLADVVGLAGIRSGQGYWIVTGAGQVFAFGRAPRLGTSATRGLTGADAVGMAGTGDSHGYWVATANGLVFAFGDAGTLGAPATHGIVLRNAVALVRR